MFVDTPEMVNVVLASTVLLKSTTPNETFPGFPWKEYTIAAYVNDTPGTFKMVPNSLYP